MTTVTFYSEGSRLTGLEMKGHSGYAPQGEDIVCAALTLGKIGRASCRERV